MSLPREVIRWLQSLDLTFQIKNPKWDLSNGYLIAEIFSWYHPQEIQMHMFNNGSSLDSKQRNWDLIHLFLKRQKYDIPEELIDGTIHCREGAAALFAEKLFLLLTNRIVRKVSPEYEVDFTDSAYQAQLPMHARSTAAQAIRNNLKSSELKADQSLILEQQKAHAIIANHIENRNQERVENPARFDKKPTLGELAIRSAPPQQLSDRGETPATESAKPQSGGHMRSGGQVQFKEVRVKQLDREQQKSLAA